MLGLSRIAASRLLRPASLSSGRLVSGDLLPVGRRLWSSDTVDTHDDFKPKLKQPASPAQAKEKIEEDIRTNPVMVYMKGEPLSPMCGFSAMVVRILEEQGVEFRSRNVLADEVLRQAIKDFTKWPTIPQVFVKGDFVGGCDIMINMHRSGELDEMLKGAKQGKGAPLD